MSIETPHGVVISLGEIYAQVIGLNVKVDVLLSQHADTMKDNADHEMRLRMLERARWPLPTLTALVAIAALILSFIKISS